MFAAWAAGWLTVAANPLPDANRYVAPMPFRPTVVPAISALLMAVEAEPPPQELLTKSPAFQTPFPAALIPAA